MEQAARFARSLARDPLDGDISAEGATQAVAILRFRNLVTLCCTPVVAWLLLWAPCPATALEGVHGLLYVHIDMPTPIQQAAGTRVERSHPQSAAPGDAFVLPPGASCCLLSAGVLSLKP